MIEDMGRITLFIFYYSPCTAHSRSNMARFRRFSSPAGSTMTIQNDTASESYLEWGVIVVARRSRHKRWARRLLHKLALSLAPAVPTAADYKQSCTQ